MVLLFRYNSYQGSAWFSTANAVMGKVYEWDSEVQAYFSLVEVNRELTQRNIYLEKQVETLDSQLTTATATPDPSRICELHHSSWQRWILNPTSKARH